MSSDVSVWAWGMLVKRLSMATQKRDAGCEFQPRRESDTTGTLSKPSCRRESFVAEGFLLLLEWVPRDIPFSSPVWTPPPPSGGVAVGRIL